MVEDREGCAVMTQPGGVAGLNLRPPCGQAPFPTLAQQATAAAQVASQPRMRLESSVPGLLVSQSRALCIAQEVAGTDCAPAVVAVWGRGAGIPL